MVLLIHYLLSQSIRKALKPTELFSKHENQLNIAKNSLLCVFEFLYLLSVMITVLVVIVAVSVGLAGRERHGVVSGRVSGNHYKAYLNRMHFLAGTAQHR